MFKESKQEEVTSLTQGLTVAKVEEKKTFDGLLIHHLGQFGRFQWFLFLSLAVTAVAATWHNLIHVFTGAVPSFQCQLDQPTVMESFLQSSNTSQRLTGSTLYDCPDSNKSESATNQCTRVANTSKVDSGYQCEVITCTQWAYDTTQYQSSIVTEWDLVCDDKWKISFVQSLHMLGCMLGAIIFGELSDRYGRRRILLVTTVMTIATGISTAFVQTFEMYAIMRLMIGVTVSGQFNCAYIIAIELVGPKWRSIAGIMMMYLAAFGIMIMAGLAFLVRDWRHLQLVVSAPLALLLVYFIVAPESPRWLLVHKKVKGAKLLIEKIARYNGKKLPQDYMDWLNHEGETHGEAGRRYTALDLFRTPQIRIKTLTLCLIWFVISVTYYGLSLYTSNLGGNNYLNFFISGAVELPAYTFSIWCLQRFGRRCPLGISMGLAGGILLLTSAFGDERPIIRIVLSMCGKMCISVAYVIIYPFSVEIFPTVIRNNGLGVVSTGARIGGFVAPYILLLGDISKVIPLVICGAVALVGGAIAIMLPETSNMQLPETMEDAENMKHHSLHQIFRKLFRKSLHTSKTDKVLDSKIIVELELCAGDTPGSVHTSDGDNHRTYMDDKHAENNSLVNQA